MLKTHRCEQSLKRECSIRFLDDRVLACWGLTDYCGFAPYDDYVNSVYRIDYCPFCGSKLETNKRTHYDVPLLERLDIYKALKHPINGFKIRPTDFLNMRSTAFTTFHFDNETLVRKITVDSKDQLDIL